MFLLGAAKNVGADPLSQSVELLLERLKHLSGASFLADEVTVADIGAHITWKLPISYTTRNPFTHAASTSHQKVAARHLINFTSRNRIDHLLTSRSFSGARGTPPTPAAIAALARAQQRVHDRFAAAELCARHTIMAWHQQGRCAAAAPAGRDGAGPPGHEPDLEMAFVQATLQLRASEDLLRRVLRPPRRAAAAPAAAPASAVAAAAAAAPPR
jgi:hypothetical protein